jgi:hypothetical protein
VGRDAKYAALLVLSLIVGQVEARAQSSDARLSQEEQQRLEAAHEMAQNNPTVRWFKERNDAHEKELETYMRNLMLSADSSLGPVLGKVKGPILDKIEAARDPANRAIEALSKATETLDSRDQQQAEAEMNRQHYEATAKKLIEINPDHKDAGSKVLDLKLSAGKHLDSGQMQQLFSQMDRDLDLNHEQRKAILKETGYDGLKYDDFTGIIDWEATRDAAKEFAANNSAGENAKPSEEKPQLTHFARNQATPIPPRGSVENLSPPLLGVAVVALLTAIWLLYRRKPSQLEMQATDDALVSNEAWIFADCPRCEWRHANPDGVLDSEASLKCASCGGVFEPKWRQEQES